MATSPPLTPDRIHSPPRLHRARGDGGKDDPINHGPVEVNHGPVEVDDVRLGKGHYYRVAVTWLLAITETLPHWLVKAVAATLSCFSGPGEGTDNEEQTWRGYR